MLKRVRNSLTIFVLFSLFAHLCVWLSLNWGDQWTRLPSSGKDVVEIEFKSRDSRMQIIEQDKKALNDEIPEDAKFLGRHNQRVVKETKASQTGDYRNTGARGGEPKKLTGTPKESARGRKPRTEGDLPSLAALTPKFNVQEQRRPEDASGSEGPASATNDYLKNVAPSLETRLNSREFVYYSYYQRIRAQLRQYWEPNIREKVRKIFAQGRSIASTSDHITRVVIVLDKMGSLLKVQVVNASGVQDLDEAAVEAFRAAEPFPNPPDGIIDADGTIKIQWDFILEA